jgi:hypothetical protein
MADDEKSESTALARKQQSEARSQALAIAGKRPNVEVFWCVSCGFSDGGHADDGAPVVKYPRGLSLEFAADEVEALGGDIRSYGGPCPVCNSMTLVPMDEFGPEFKSLREEVGESKRREYAEQAEVQADILVDRVKQEIAGSVFSGAMTDPAPADIHDPGKRNE